jgi:hypothetical protein
MLGSWASATLCAAGALVLTSGFAVMQVGPASADTGTGVGSVNAGGSSGSTLVWICKYVGKPGSEHFSPGPQPMSVSVNATSLDTDSSGVSTDAFAERPAHRGGGGGCHLRRAG